MVIEKSIHSQNEDPRIEPCKGCFCYIATWRAEGDHYVDLNFREGVVEPKIQPRVINSAQGLMGYFQKVFLKEPR
jgi:hypothetical protein